MNGSPNALTNSDLVASLVLGGTPPPLHDRKLKRQMRSVYRGAADSFKNLWLDKAWPMIQTYIAKGEVDEEFLKALSVVSMTDDLPQFRLDVMEDWVEVFLKHMMLGYQVGGHAQFRALGGKGKFNLRNKAEIALLNDMASIFSRQAILQTLEPRLHDWMVKAAVAGEDVVKYNIAPKTVPLADINHTVAVMSGFNQGKARVTEKSWKGGEVRKVWRHAGVDKQRRPHHQAMEGVSIPINERFYVGPSGVRYPHDWSSAGCEEWCNCHCYVQYVPQRGSKFEPWSGE